MKKVFGILVFLLIATVSLGQVKVTEFSVGSSHGVAYDATRDRAVLATSNIGAALIGNLEGQPKTLAIASGYDGSRTDIYVDIAAVSSSNGLHLYDISQGSLNELPNSPIVGFFTGPVKFDSRGFLYAIITIPGSNTAPTQKLVGVDNDATIMFQPVALPSGLGNINDIAICNKNVYIGTQSGNIVNFDISTPNQPKLVSTIPISGVQVSRLSCDTISDGLWVVSNGKTQLYETSAFTIKNSIPMNCNMGFSIVGNYVGCANTSSIFVINRATLGNLYQYATQNVGYCVSTGKSMLLCSEPLVSDGGLFISDFQNAPTVPVATSTPQNTNTQVIQKTNTPLPTIPPTSAPTAPSTPLGACQLDLQKAMQDCK